MLKPHGLRGEFILYMESDFPDWLAGRPCFFVERAGRMISWPVENTRFHGEKLVVKVEALRDRNEVEAARDTPLFLTEAEARTATDDPDYFYNSDLVGLEMLEAGSGESYGHVVAVHEMPAHNLLEVERGDGGSFLFPFTKALIEDLDLDRGRISVTMPEGLVDANDK